MATKIILAQISPNRLYTITAPIMEEDYGLRLVIQGIDLPASYEVDFSNSASSGTSVTNIGDEDGVEIPVSLIDTGKDVYAYLYWVGSGWGRTIYTIRIPNKRRPKRTSEIPTPTQQSVIDQTIAALNDAVEATAADAEQTASDAARAEAARTAAESAEDNAEASANAAAQSASRALNSATSANMSALSAREDALTASRDADRAEQAAAQSGYLWFYIEDGKLYMDRTQNTHVNFYMQDGKLYVEEVS